MNIYEVARRRQSRVPPESDHPGEGP